MAFAATVRQEARTAERHATELDSTLRDAERRPVDVLVHDLSANGLRLTASAALAPGGVVTVGLPGLGVRGAMIVRAEGDVYGCRFLERLTNDELARALCAVVTAPIPITPAAHEALLQQEVVPAAPRYPARLRVLAIGGAVAAGWALLWGLRALL